MVVFVVVVVVDVVVVVVVAVPESGNVVAEVVDDDDCGGGSWPARKVLNPRRVGMVAVSLICKTLRLGNWVVVAICGIAS